MLTRLHLRDFKSFRDADLSLGPFTLLIGTNASGKSNIRDAFRFLHGIGRGYSLADIIGEKYGQGGELQWRGIRGGTREIAFQAANTFRLDVFLFIDEGGERRRIDYAVEIAPETNGKAPHIIQEQLRHEILLPYERRVEFEISVDSTTSSPHVIMYQMETYDENGQESERHFYEFVDNETMLSQVIEDGMVDYRLRNVAKMAISVFRSMRFLDLSPDVMRQPSFQGQITLGDRGENLSSVLQDICAEPQRKQLLLQWLQELTPMDAVDFDFPADQIGRVLVTLVEEHGQRTTAYSASDGTLRFLGMLAAFLGSEPAHFYFFEELENGIHPTRLHLLLQLIEQQTTQQSIQVVATTHSPQLLRLISPKTLKNATLTYRLRDQPDTRITPILDIADARRVLEDQDLARLHESGWLEDAVTLMQDEAHI